MCKNIQYMVSEDAGECFGAKNDSSQIVFELIVLLQKIENTIGSQSLSDSIGIQLESPL